MKERSELRHYRGQLEDIKTNAVAVEIRTIFDIGANVGQSYRAYRIAFSEADIHSFEPVPAAYGKLARVMTGDARAHPNRIAFGREDRDALITAVGTSTGNRIARAGGGKTPTEPVQLMRGDTFCDERGIDRINFLKIDTEGADMDVLVGFSRMLSAQRIDFIQVEAGMNKTNVKHISYRSFDGFLDPLDYMLFGIYEPAFERDGRPLMRRANLVYISRKALDECRPAAQS